LRSDGSATGGSRLGTVADRLAVVGMAAFFTATVRSQLTGIVLVSEMTWTFSLALPMLLASAGAYAVSALVGNPPIYDTLRERQVARARPERS